jgi:hypothetical protein
MHIGALENAAANMGGIAVADRRTGAAVFNRAAATTLGLLAATGDQPSAQNIWEGERGLKNLFSIAGEDTQTYDGISTAGLRLFPYSGFIQSQNRWKLLGFQAWGSKCLANKGCNAVC